MEELLRKLEAWTTGHEKHIDALVSRLDRRVRRLQRELMLLISSILFPKLKTNGGKLIYDAVNMARASLVDKAVDRLSASNTDLDLLLFADELIETGAMQGDYYKQLGFSGARLSQIEKSLLLLKIRIGLDENGRLAQNGYLYRLGHSEEVRQQLRNFVVTAIATKTDLASFMSGMEAMVTGQDTDGVLQRYWRQYAYDTYNQAAEIVNLDMADRLGLNYFIYGGTVILTTRDFCRKKNGKVFSRDEAAKWPNDPDLIDKKTKDQYHPLIDRGRYNCRHRVNWITDEIAFDRRPELKSTA